MKTSEWEGYKKLEFDVGDRPSFIICPKKAAKGNPWIWRAEFFGAFDFPDRDLLEKGWAIGYTQCCDMYGCPKSVEYFEEFYQICVNTYGLSPKPSIFGFSRGALYATYYALTYPDHCGSLYLDAPVLDMRSWPGGIWKGKGAEYCWNECAPQFGYKDTEDFCKNFRGHPVDRAAELAKTGIPVLIVYGDSDIVVPHDENAIPFYHRFVEAGGDIRMIGKRNCDHHPHSLCPAYQIVSFVESHFEA